MGRRGSRVGGGAGEDHGRTRLLVDWNIGLLFGRDTAELGRIGEPRGLVPPRAEASVPKPSVRRVS